MRALPLDHGAPLAAHLLHRPCAVQLVCGACTWSRLYKPERIIAGLKARRLGDAQTAVGAVAHHVRWPCPGCRRMRWGTRLVAP